MENDSKNPDKVVLIIGTLAQLLVLAGLSLGAYMEYKKGEYGKMAIYGGLAVADLILLGVRLGVYIGKREENKSIDSE